VNFAEYAQTINPELFDAEYWQKKINEAAEKVSSADCGALSWAAKQNESLHLKCLKTARQVDDFFERKDAAGLMDSIDGFFSAHRELIIAHRKSYKKEVQR
jgi:flagellar biosynthesis/type III secretory pathway ATPase